MQQHFLIFLLFLIIKILLINSEKIIIATNGKILLYKFLKLNGVEFYNDSKATNVKSTQIALNAFDKPTILILGGLDRGHSFDELENYLKNTKLIVCYGETKNRIKDFADRIDIKCIVKDNLKDATLECFNNSETGDVVLLSPACASWDQYKAFEDRGNEFKNTVYSFKEE